MRAGEADAVDAVDLVHRLEQRREVARRIVRRLVVVHDLAEQLHLPAAAVGERPDLSVGVGGISETKRNKKTLCLVASATTPRLGHARGGRPARRIPNFVTACA